MRLRRKQYRVLLHVDILNVTETVREGWRFGDMEVFNVQGNALIWRVEMEGHIRSRYAGAAIRKALRQVRCLVGSGVEITAFTEETH